MKLFLLLINFHTLKMNIQKNIFQDGVKKDNELEIINIFRRFITTS